MKRLDVSTKKVWLWGRLRVSEGEDKAPVLALEKQFTLVPLSALRKPTTQSRTAALPPLPRIEGDDLGFFVHLAAALKDNAVRREDKALFAQFVRIGLGSNGFDASKLSPERRKGLLHALKDGPSVAASSFVTAAVQRNGWSWAAADTDEAGHAFQFEAGHLYRSEAGHRSDLMSATGGLLPRIEVDDVSGDRIGQARIDFKSTNVAFAGFRR